MKKKSFREKLSIFEGKYKENKLLSCGCTLDLWWNWEQNQNFSNAVLPQRGAVLSCARHSPLEMLLLSLRKGRNYNVNLASWDCEIWPKWMTCLPTSPAHDRDFILLNKLCSRGSWVDLQPFLAHCTNAIVCACLYFFWRIAAATDAVVWHLTPALPFWDTAEPKSVVEGTSASDSWCSLSGTVCV